jgi:hypothetical protein
MADELTFFSSDWCKAAMPAVNESETMMRGFKDPASFTNKMAFTCSDRDLTTHVEWKAGQVVAWSPPIYDEDDLWLIISADVATWRLAAEGGSEGGTLLMVGKIKFVKGPMSAAIENGGAFNSFLRAWGDVPTDWNV